MKNGIYPVRMIKPVPVMKLLRGVEPCQVKRGIWKKGSL